MGARSESHQLYGGAPQTRIGRLGKNSISYTRWTGSLAVSYQATDHGGRVHDANNVSYNYSREFDQSQTGSTVMKSKLPGPVPVFVSRPAKWCRIRRKTWNRS